MATPPPDIIAAAREAQRKWKIPASISLAQWALESGWGRHMPPGSNNPFGMKARPGDPFVTVRTREQDRDAMVAEAAVDDHDIAGLRARRRDVHAGRHDADPRRIDE